MALYDNVPTFRGTVRAHLLEIGLPSEHVDEVVDLAMHAADQAMVRMANVLEAGSTISLQNTATSLAVTLLINHLSEAQQAMMAEAKKRGLNTHTGSINVRRGTA